MANPQLRLSEALNCMNTALHLLDEADAPGHISSHLDLAICRLETAIGHGGVSLIEGDILAAELERIEARSTEAPKSLWDEKISAMGKSPLETAASELHDA